MDQKSARTVPGPDPCGSGRSSYPASAHHSGWFLAATSG